MKFENWKPKNGFLHLVTICPFCSDLLLNVLLPHILSRLDALARADVLFQLHPCPFGAPPRPSNPHARFAEEVAENLGKVAASGGYLSLAAFFYEVIDILLNDLAVASNFSQAEDHASVCAGLIRWLDETVLLLDSVEPSWSKDFGFRGMIHLLILYGQLRRSAFGDVLVITGDVIWVPEYLFPTLRAVYRWAVEEPGEILPANVDKRFFMSFSELPVTAAAAEPILHWPESRKPHSLEGRMRAMRYTRLVITSLTFPGSRAEGRPQVRLMGGGKVEEDEDDEVEEEEVVVEEEEEEEDRICPEFLGFFPSSVPAAVALLSQDEARARQLKVMQHRHKGEVVLVQGPVPLDSPFYAKRDQASG